jgi:hypothetical protein
MIRFGLRPLLLPLALFAWSGCAQKYTRHMSETYKEKKIDAVTFGVIALPELTYNPPSSCMSGGNKGDGTKYRAEWDKMLMKKLSAAFKKQRFVSIPAERLEEIGISAPTFQSRAEEDLEKMGVQEYEAQGGTVRPIEYLPAHASGQMREWGMKLREKDSIDYIIALVDPKMTGEIRTTYNAAGGANGMGGGMSSTTVYTSNARFGIWSAETGELAYASGSIAASSGFCIFMSPQSMSLDGNTGDMSTQLKALITAFLNRLPAERLEVGQASSSAPEAVPALP